MGSEEAKRAAGKRAEKQQAFYLHRAFGLSSDIVVLNDIRIEDAEQPEADGSVGVCQLDHLILHRFGAVIVESKSVSDEVSVKGDGHGGDEWARKYGGRQQAFPSPIRQASRQGAFLRVLLQREREQLLGKMPKGTRMIAKLIAGSDQRGFAQMPIQIIVSISDSGKIRRVGGWKEPQEPFPVYVCKADLVTEYVAKEIERHQRHSRLTGPRDGDYGMWAMKPEEVQAVTAFLSERHTPRVQKPAAAVDSAGSAPLQSTPKHVSAAACRDCASSNLEAKWGRYGYYWMCRDCGKNTAMPTECSVCGVVGSRGETVRIRKDGPKYFRCCTACGIEERIWTA